MRNILRGAAKSRTIKPITALATVMLMAGAANAQAATDAGRTVSNTFTLDYSVNDTPQTQIDNTANPTDFTVDRLIDLTVLETNSVQTVAPDQGAIAGTADDPVLTFDVTNTGNDNQSFSFSTENLGGDFNFVPGTEVITVTIPAIPAIPLANGTTPPQLARPAETVIITALNPEVASAAVDEFTPDIPPGVTVSVAVSGVIPDTVVDGDVEDIILVAEIRDPEFWIFEGASGTAGQNTTSDVTDGNDLVNAAQNVFADEAGDSDAANDGLFSDTGSFLVATPNLTGAKTVRVIASDSTAADCATIPAVGDNSAPLAADTTQFSIPGACVEYTITVTNAFPAGGTTSTPAERTATGIDIVDVLPDELIFIAAQVGDVFSVNPTDDNVLATETDCAGGACSVEFIDGELIGAVDASTPQIGTIVIRALLK